MLNMLEKPCHDSCSIDSSSILKMAAYQIPNVTFSNPVHDASDMISAARQIEEETREHNVALIMIFIDPTNPFDIYYY